MFDQASRSMWLEDQLWPKLREAFPDLQQLPENALVAVGYPSSGARGRSDKIRPCEINQQWTGNSNEQVFISVHPVYFDSPCNVAKAILFQAMKATRGNRWGASRAGLDKLKDGTITANRECQSKSDAMLADVGDPPSGYGVAFPVRRVSRARLRPYVLDHSCVDADNNRMPTNLRIASDFARVECGVCHQAYRRVP